ncbi:glutathione S-transferase U7 [Ricinus communis]|uniref:glutathione transferase n=1 Tax=Ricinus communis TaxID=3988 RepID=B9S3A3_RICCO|nr:glutathione S-transferase U7 [Ricinus communis]EEF41885.1 glutathione s-transferase, putative [Ricinus communis]|eukprot:XP_002520472.1 glutathione S-transferase U7 [Ricinus communis]
MTEEVKLLGTWASPFSHRIELALKLKGIQYEYIEEDLSNKSTLLLSTNPVHKKIPVLIHNGKPIAESLVILEYIEETWPNNPILPKDPYNRALARFWAKFVEEKILQTASKFRVAKEEEKKQIYEELDQQLKVLENELREREFSGGESIGFVDIVAFFILYWFQVRQEVLQLSLISKEKFPVLCKYVDKLLEIDMVKECLPPKEKHLAYVRAHFEAAKSSSK